VRLSGFFDAGQIYVKGNELPERAQDDLQGFRYSAGLGLAWNSPIGPLKFSYALPLNNKPLDKLQRFQFQVGTIF